MNLRPLFFVCGGLLLGVFGGLFISFSDGGTTAVTEAEVVTKQIMAEEVVLSDDSEGLSKFEQASLMAQQDLPDYTAIVALLREELDENPESEKTLVVLAHVYFQINEFEKSLDVMDKAIALDNKKEIIKPSKIVFKARVLYRLCRKEEALKILNAYNAFWLGSPGEAEVDKLKRAITIDLNQGRCPPTESVSSYEELETMAEEGDAEAQTTLGAAYAKKQDFENARMWWVKAAKQGHTGAQYNLGLMYVTGTGVDKDSAKAFKWFKLAANQGLADAQNSLGVMYFHGDGVEQSYEKAEMWYQKAADQGHHLARRTLEENKRNKVGQQ